MAESSAESPRWIISSTFKPLSAGKTMSKGQTIRWWDQSDSYCIKLKLQS